MSTLSAIFYRGGEYPGKIDVLTVSTILIFYKRLWGSSIIIPGVDVIMRTVSAI